MMNNQMNENEVIELTGFQKVVYLFSVLISLCCLYYGIYKVVDSIINTVKLFTNKEEVQSVEDKELEVEEEEE